MNVITAYLETMFSTYPQTPRLLEAKTELQTMMEDAYTALIAEGHSENEAVGRVITEFGNLDELAPVLGITNDISPVPASPGDDAVASRGAGQSRTAAAEPQHPRHTMPGADPSLVFETLTEFSETGLSQVRIVTIAGSWSMTDRGELMSGSSPVEWCNGCSSRNRVMLLTRGEGPQSPPRYCCQIPG